MNAQAQQGFQHRHAAHCESGTAANLLTHGGLKISEPMAFGLGKGLSFAYLPFIQIQGMPLIAYRAVPRGIIRGLSQSVGVPFHIERFASPSSGMARLDALLDQGQVVGLQTSVFWLPYFPQDMRFHFNAHNLVVYGREGDSYLISDPVIEHPVRCGRADLERARFAKGALAPKGLLYYATPSSSAGISRHGISKSILGVCRTMLAPIPFVGSRGINMLANRVEKLSATEPSSSVLLGHVVRMQEEIGTGGGGFRFIYAAFLQEAASVEGLKHLNEFSERLLEIGDAWRTLALRAARMVKGRDALDPGAIADLLRRQSDSESRFFKDLRACQH